MQDFPDDQTHLEHFPAQVFFHFFQLARIVNYDLSNLVAPESRTMFLETLEVSISFETQKNGDVWLSWTVQQ